MKKNKVKEILKKGGTVIGAQVAEMRSPNIARLFSIAGFDFIFIDLEHSGFNMETVEDFIMASKASDITPIVRIPELEYHLISRPLDLGAEGLIIPQINTVEDIKKIIRFTKYAPIGERGLCPGRGWTDFTIGNIPELMKFANEEAVENIENLLSIKEAEEVDVVFMGLTDLSQSLGVPGQVNHPKVQKCIDKVMNCCEKQRIVFGGPVPNIELYKKGMRFLYVTGDIRLIINGGREIVNQFRNVVAQEKEKK